MNVGHTLIENLKRLIHSVPDQQRLLPFLHVHIALFNPLTPELNPPPAILVPV